jgi:hypothetical protein
MPVTHTPPECPTRVLYLLRGQGGSQGASYLNHWMPGIPAAATADGTRSRWVGRIAADAAYGGYENQMFSNVFQALVASPEYLSLMADAGYPSSGGAWSTLISFMVEELKAANCFQSPWETRPVRRTPKRHLPAGRAKKGRFGQEGMSPWDPGVKAWLEAERERKGLSDDSADDSADDEQPTWIYVSGAVLGLLGIYALFRRRSRRENA